MSYKRTITGKHKITGNLERAIERFRSYHRADFPSGTLHIALPFANWLGTMTGILADCCRQPWTDKAAKQELAARHMVYDRARHEEPDSSYTEMARYELLNYVVEHISPENLSELEARARQLIIEDKEELFLPLPRL